MKKLFDGRIDRRVSLGYLRKQTDKGLDIKWGYFGAVIEYHDDFYVPFDLEIDESDRIILPDYLDARVTIDDWKYYDGVYSRLGYIVDRERDTLWYQYKKDKQ